MLIEFFFFHANRLARIKAEAKRRREERERLEATKQMERVSRMKQLMEQFVEWSTTPDSRVELQLVCLRILYT